MTARKFSMCPLFPDLPCPRGEEASEECAVRVNGDFDPVQYFRDELIMHCAIYQNEKKQKTLAEK